MKQLIPPSSGSVAGETYSRNRFGQYIRKRSTPVNPSTAKQVARRAAVTAASVNWKGLTDAQRNAWKAWAENHPKVDTLGQTIYLTGFQWFVSAYQNAVTCGQIVPVIPPEEPVWNPNIITGIESTDDDLTINGSAPNANEHIIARFSAPRSAGVSFEKDFRVVRILANGNVFPFNIKAEYVGVFGTPQPGQKIFSRFNQVKAGIMGPDMNYDTIYTVEP